MSAPFEECQGCIATPFCKAYRGEVDLKLKTWCRPKLRLDRAIEMAKIPKLYRQSNIYNFIVDEHNMFVRQDLTPYLEEIVATVEGGKNFIIYGHKPGTGKTYAAMCLLNQYIYKTCQTVFDFENPVALYVGFAEMAHAMKFGQTDDQIQQQFETIRNVPLLLIDDIGTGAINDTIRDQTFRLVNYRLNEGLSTIVTSNYTLKELDQDTKLGSRIVSRLMADTVGLEIGGKDRRKFG